MSAIDQFKPISRRTFLTGAGMAAAGCIGESVPLTGTADDFDEDFAVLLADIHLCGNDALTDRLFTRDLFDRRISEILAMRPLPRRVIHFGDLALENGDVHDYRLAAEKIRRLESVGITFIHMMGNHDRRDTFASVFPKVGYDSPVPGRYVSIVPFSSCDLLLLDSLAAADGQRRSADPAQLDEAQQAWLGKALPAWKRPVIVCAHHPFDKLAVGGEPLKELLIQSPQVVGWINGHCHIWNRGVCFTWGRQEDTIRTMGLPSASFFLDIGLVKFHVRPTVAEAELVQDDYFFFGPLRPGEKRPEIWDAVIRDNRGERCTFPLTRMNRPWQMSPS